MGNNTITAVVVGALIVVVAFSLWPILNGATNSLYAYFRDSCDDGSGNRFLAVYVGDDTSTLPGTLAADAYYTNFDVHGGMGAAVSEDRVNNFTPGSTSAQAGVDDDCEVTITLPEDVLAEYSYAPNPSSAIVLSYSASDPATHNLSIYNEYGDSVGALTITLNAGPTTGAGAATGYVGIAEGTTIVVEELGGSIYIAPSKVGCVVGTTSKVIVTPCQAPPGGLAAAQPSATITEWAGYNWVKVAGVLNFFSGINNILLAIIPVVSIGGFLGISGAKLYSYGRSTGGNIASHLSGSVFTLVALIITIIIAPVIMDSLIGANQVVESGQYRINNQFGTILELLFGAIPLLYIAGLVGLIGMQARSALMGNRGGDKMM